MSAAPIAARVLVYRCPFCRRSRTKCAATKAHMAHCFKNPERAPRTGELSRPVRGDVAEPAWWPGEGKIWDGKAWLDVPGYKAEDRLDPWPVHEGTPLDRCPLSMRLDVLFSRKDEACQPEF